MNVPRNRIDDCFTPIERDIADKVLKEFFIQVNNLPDNVNLADPKILTEIKDRLDLKICAEIERIDKEQAKNAD